MKSPLFIILRKKVKATKLFKNSAPFRSCQGKNHRPRNGFVFSSAAHFFTWPSFELCGRTFGQLATPMTGPVAAPIASDGN
jgi:hypothetical protein